MADQLIGQETNLDDGAYANLVWDGSRYQYKVYSSGGTLQSTKALYDVPSGKTVVQQLKTFAEGPNTTLVRGMELDEKTGFRRVAVPDLKDERPMYAPGMGEDSGLTEGVDYTETDPSDPSRGTMSEAEMSAARQAELRAAQKRRHAFYGGAMALGEAAASIPMLLPTEYEKEIKERADDTPEGMSATEEADLTRFILSPAQQMARESRLRGEAIKASGMGAVTSARDVLQEKKAQVQGMAEAAVKAGAVIAQEKMKALKEDIAEIKDAKAAKYAIQKERRKAASDLAGNLTKIVGYYGGYAPTKPRLGTLDQLKLAGNMSAEQAGELTKGLENPLMPLDDKRIDFLFIKQGLPIPSLEWKRNFLANQTTRAV